MMDPFPIALIIIVSASTLFLGWFVVFTIHIMKKRTRNSVASWIAMYLISMVAGGGIGFGMADIATTEGILITIAVGAMAAGGIIGHFTGYLFRKKLVKSEAKDNVSYLLETPRQKKDKP